MKYEIKVNVPTASGWDEQDVTKDLMVTDLSEDMSKVAAQIAYYGGQAGSTNALVSKLEVEFKSWKAKTAQEVLKAEPKMAEWKTKAIVEGRDECVTFVNKIAEAQKNADGLWAVYNGFRAKVNMLQSKGAMMREELGATGLQTPARKPVKSTARPAKQKV